MSTKQNAALVLRLYEAFDKGSLDDFTESIGSNFVAQVLGTTILDWIGFKQFGNTFLSAFQMVVTSSNMLLQMERT